MNLDENLNPQLEEEFAKHLPQILAAWGDAVDAASSAISGTRSGRHNIPPGMGRISDTPSRRAMRGMMEEVVGLSNLSFFDSRLLFITGPGTNNLVLCFFSYTADATHQEQEAWRLCQVRRLRKMVI